MSAEWLSNGTLFMCGTLNYSSWTKPRVVPGSDWLDASEIVIEVGFAFQAMYVVTNKSVYVLGECHFGLCGEYQNGSLIIED